jgi:hypothetical protein
MLRFAVHPADEFHIPDRIKAPVGHSLLLRAYARGVQVYACPDSPAPAPFAVLLKNERPGEDLLAIHFLESNDLVWQALDGSKCLGDRTNARDLLSPDPESISWSLIPARGAGSPGLLSRVTFVQRLFTQGGQIRPDSWKMKLDGNPLLIEFTAQYFFYTAS